MAEEKKNKPHYVNNAEFLEHMIAHNKAVKFAKRNKLPPPRVSEEIGLAIVKIANKVANMPNFANYPFREEMIADGIENSLTYVNNFNPKISKKPFAYFTQIIYFAFLRRIEKEKKHLYAKYKSIEQLLLHDVHEEDRIQIQKYGSDHSDGMMHEFMEKFEKKKGITKKRGRKKKKKTGGLEEFVGEE